MSSYKDQILSFLEKHPDYKSILPSSPEKLIQENILVDPETFRFEEVIGQGAQGVVYKATIPEKNQL